MCGRGVRPTRLCELHAPGSHRSAGMSHAPISFGAQRRTQTFNLWFVGPALHQLSYSGEKLVVGVGIEPTFRAFQTRANPSQLSDRLERAVRLELTILDLQSSALATWRRAQIGTEGEIRTLESSLEDSHVSSYITSAKNHCHKEAQKTQKRFLCFVPFVAKNLVGEDRVELSPRVPRTRMRTLHHTPKLKLAELNGLEPSST